MRRPSVGIPGMGSGPSMDQIEESLRIQKHLGPKTAIRPVPREDWDRAMPYDRAAQRRRELNELMDELDRLDQQVREMEES